MSSRRGPPVYRSQENFDSVFAARARTNRAVLDRTISFEMARTDRESCRQSAELGFALDQRDAPAALGQAQGGGQPQRAAAQHANSWPAGIKAGVRHRQRQIAR